MDSCSPGQVHQDDQRQSAPQRVEQTLRNDFINPRSFIFTVPGVMDEYVRQFAELEPVSGNHCDEQEIRPEVKCRQPFFIHSLSFRFRLGPFRRMPSVLSYLTYNMLYSQLAFVQPLRQAGISLRRLTGCGSTFSNGMTGSMLRSRVTSAGLQFPAAPVPTGVPLRPPDNRFPGPSLRPTGYPVDHWCNPSANG